MNKQCGVSRKLAQKCGFQASLMISAFGVLHEKIGSLIHLIKLDVGDRPFVKMLSKIKNPIVRK